MRSYQLKELGILNGGFWFYDPSAEEVIPVHRKTPEDAIVSAQSFPLPYSWTKPPGTGIEKLLDEMWYLWRRWDSVQGPWDNRHWPPEYYVDMPSRQPADPADAITRFWSESACHYCSYGE